MKAHDTVGGCSERRLTYLCLSIANSQKLDGILKKLAAKLVLQGSTVKIIGSDWLHWGLQDLHKFKDLPLNIQNSSA